MTALETIGLVVAISGGVLGSALGVINLWRDIDRKRVRLKVIPKLAHMVGGNVVITTRDDSNRGEYDLSRYPMRLCIEVINLSDFAVTISAVGFGDNTQIFNPETPPGKDWPTRLERREAVTLYAGVGQEFPPAAATYPVAFVKTDCGITKKGTSPILKKHFQALRKSEASS